MKHVILGAACTLALLSACSQHAPINSTASEPLNPTAPAQTGQTTSTSTADEATLAAAAAAKAALPHIGEDCPKIDGIYGTSRYDKKKLTSTPIEGGFRYDLDGEFLADGKEHALTREHQPVEASYIANCKNGRLIVTMRENKTDVAGKSVPGIVMSLQLYFANEELDLVIEGDDGEKKEKKLVTNMTPQPLIANLAELNSHDSKACPTFTGQVEFKDPKAGTHTNGAITIEQSTAGPRYLLTADSETFLDVLADGKTRRAKHKEVDGGDSVKTACISGTLHLLWMNTGDIVQHWKLAQTSASTASFELRKLDSNQEIDSFKIELTRKPQM